MNGSHFGKGTKVEVTSDEEGFRGSWYTATILRCMLKKQRYKVQYHNLLDGSDESKPLIEFIGFSSVRPYPPQEPCREFELQETVDAFHNDGWWCGVVVNVLHELLRYTVRFHFTNEEIEFGQLDLRGHVDWKDGRWVPAQRLLIQINGGNEGHTLQENNFLQVQDGTNLDSLEECSQAINSADISEAGDAGEKVEERSNFAATDSISQKRKNLGREGKGPEVFLHACNTDQLSEVAIPVNRPEDAGEKAKEKSNYVTADSIRKKRKKYKRKGKGRSSLSCKILDNTDRMEGIHGPVACQSSMTGIKTLSIVKSVDDTIIQAIEARAITTVDLPSLNIVGIDNPLHSMYKQSEGDDLPHSIYTQSEGDDLPHSIYTQSEGDDLPHSMHKQLEVDDLPTMRLLTNFVPQYPKRKRSDILEGREGKGAMKLPVRRSSRAKLKVFYPNAQTKDADMVDLTVDEIHQEETPLPFVKSSPLWTTIESMEAFSTTPQQPHFSPLKQYREVQREGMALVHMVSFANLIAEINKSQLDEPRDLFENMLSTLLDLEQHGFDVQPARAALENLLSLKDRHEEVNEKTSIALEKLRERKCDLDGINGRKEQVEAEINVKTDELQKIEHERNIKTNELKQLEHERIIIDRFRVPLLNEFSKLQTEIQANQEEAQKTENEFISIATSL